MQFIHAFIISMPGIYFFCGIEQQIISNSAAYIQGWLKALKNDKRLILKAATQAQAAADYIMNKTTENVIVGIEETTFIN